MYLSIYERILLSQSIGYELDTIETILSNNTSRHELTPENIAHFENGKRVLSAVLQQINTNFFAVDFDDEQLYHLRYAVALQLEALMDALLADEPMSPDEYEILSDAVNTLLLFYQRFQ